MPRLVMVPINSDDKTSVEYWLLAAVWIAHRCFPTISTPIFTTTDNNSSSNNL